MQAGGRILVPVDGSACSDRAVAEAALVAAATGSRLDLLYVSYFSPATDDAVTKISWLPASIAGSAGKMSDSILRHASSLLPEGLAVQCHVETGPPAPVILAFAARKKADLIVIGARGLGLVEGFLLGSVSAEILEQAACPVLVVK